MPHHDIKLAGRAILTGTIITFAAWCAVWAIAHVSHWANNL